MDVERTIEFLLEQQARLEARFEARYAAIQEQQSRIQEQQSAFQEQMAKSQVDFDDRHRKLELAQQKTEAALRRGIRLSVEEHRRERVRRQALEDKMRELATAQALTEETLRRFIESLRQPRNGHDTV